MIQDPRARKAYEASLEHVAAKDWSAAILELKRALQWAANEPFIWYNLACANYHSMQYESSLAAAKRTLSIDDKFPNLHQTLGAIYAALRQYPYAVESYITAIEQNPQSLEAHMALGNCFESLLMFEEAFECFETALILGGDRGALLSGMFYQAAHSCRWDRTERVERLLQNQITRGKNTAVPFQLLTVPSATPQQHLESARNYWQAMCGDIEPLPCLN